MSYLNGKRGLEDVIKVKENGGGKITLDYPGGLNV